MLCIPECTYSAEYFGWQESEAMVEISLKLSKIYTNQKKYVLIWYKICLSHILTSVQLSSDCDIL